MTLDLNDLVFFISNVGISSAILIYLIWRFDKFLTFLCQKLEIYNHEFAEISSSIKGLTSEVKETKEVITQLSKK